MDQRLMIAVEGIDGTGKSTLCRGLKPHLTKAGFRVHTPSYNKGSVTQSRCKYILDNDATICDEYRELLWQIVFKEVLETQIWHAHGPGQATICDRYLGSHIAYHSPLMDPITFKGFMGAGDMLEFGLHDCIIPVPELTIYLSGDFDLMLRRKSHFDATEKRGPDYYDKVLSVYQRLADRHDWVVLSAQHSKEFILGAALDELSSRKLLPKKKKNS